MARDYFQNDEDRKDHYRRLHALLGATMLNAEEVEHAWKDWCDRWPSEPAAARAVCDYGSAMLGERDFNAVMDALKEVLSSATADDMLLKAVSAFAATDAALQRAANRLKR